MTRTHKTLAAAFLAAGLLACGAAMAVPAGFDSRMDALMQHIKEDPNYKRIPLQTTADREWFFQESEAVYTKKITKDEFIAEGVKRFPGYEASFATVADFMTK